MNVPKVFIRSVWLGLFAATIAGSNQAAASSFDRDNAQRLTSAIDYLVTAKSQLGQNRWQVQRNVRLAYFQIRIVT